MSSANSPRGRARGLLSDAALAAVAQLQDPAVSQATLRELVRATPNSAYAWHLLFLSLDQRVAALRAELRFAHAAVLAAPKNYQPWRYREKLVGALLAQRRDAALLRAELAACLELLQLDARNMHAWSYRRFVLTQLRPSAADVRAELAQVCALDATPLSNNSANAHSLWLLAQSGREALALAAADAAQLAQTAEFRLTESGVCYCTELAARCRAAGAQPAVCAPALDQLFATLEALWRREARPLNLTLALANFARALGRSDAEAQFRAVAAAQHDLRITLPQSQREDRAPTPRA